MKIVYWSGSGNTEKMANLIAEGIRSEGKEADVIHVSEAKNDIFDNEDVVILGCPAMGAEVLEECEFEPFVEEISSRVSGKKAVLFGSYGWGDGEWMRNFEERMADYGCQIPLECKIVNEAPEDNDPSLIEYGKQIAKL
ncbi:MAG: flavodoxin [Clostridiales bacterium]|nr:flavodoxin [Clostridiales bacterium]NLK24252.1 flavodoxin [Clostridiales bacterium]